jgi:hypothetical protein
MSKDIIIYQPWGGLGDNLQFSTLPRLYTELGYNVYISDKNVYRNPEIFDLVWKINPYIKGISSLTPNAGSCKEFKIFQEDNCIKNMELTHGLYNGNSYYPEIYYNPKILNEYSDYILYDTTSISIKLSDDFIKTKFKLIFDKYPNLKRKLIVFKNINNRNNNLFNDDVLIVNNIFEYCDYIKSCKIFVCLFSGCSVLASAIKKDEKYPVIYSFPPEKQPRGSVYDFKNLNLCY